MPQPATLLEIHSTGRFIDSPLNRVYWAASGLTFFDRDLFDDQGLDELDRSLDIVPKPPHLRILTTQKPKRPEEGWTFGSAKECDIWLETNNEAVRPVHFAVVINPSTGVLLIRSRGNGATNVSAGGTQVRVRTQTVLHESNRIHIGKLKIDLHCPDFLSRQEEYCHLRDQHCHRMGNTDLFTNWTPSAGTTSTNSSLGMAYRRGKRIGIGGSSLVYQAVHRFTGEIVAVKEYKNLNEIHDEVTILQRIRHKHIVGLHAFVANPPEVFLEFVQGASLDEAHKKRPLVKSDLQAVLRQTLEALAYLHSLQITHRDVKPANIMVECRAPIHIKLVDFNRACSQPVMLVQAGTIFYMAPEICAKKPYGNAVDIWSLGMVALEFMCGRPKLKAQSPLSKEFRQYLITSTARLGAVASEFIQWLLTYEAQDRPSAFACLAHQFLVEGGPSSNEILKERCDYDTVTLQSTICSLSQGELTMGPPMPDTEPFTNPLDTGLCNQAINLPLLAEPSGQYSGMTGQSGAMTDFRVYKWGSQHIPYTHKGQINMTKLCKVAKADSGHIRQHIRERNMSYRVVRGRRLNKVSVAGTFVNIVQAKELWEHLGLAIEPIVNIEKLLLEERT